MFNSFVIVQQEFVEQYCRLLNNRQYCWTMLSIVEQKCSTLDNIVEQQQYCPTILLKLLTILLTILSTIDNIVKQKSSFCDRFSALFGFHFGLRNLLPIKMVLESKCFNRIRPYSQTNNLIWKTILMVSTFFNQQKYGALDIRIFETVLKQKYSKFEECIKNKRFYIFWYACIDTLSRLLYNILFSCGKSSFDHKVKARNLYTKAILHCGIEIESWQQ